jgi:DNA polymerase III gamma/tau subunit
MGNENIDTKLRPNTIKEMFTTPNEKTLVKLIEAEEIQHSYLISGPSGLGKTTMARAFASYLFTGSMEEEYDLNNSQCYIEVNGSKYTGIDNMRDLLDSVMNIPLDEDKIILVMDEAHYLTKNAQSAFLKCLEEPPEHLYIIIATDQPQKLSTPLKNRCKKITLTKPSVDTMINYTRTYVINSLLDILDSPTMAKCKPNLDNLTDTKLREIINSITDYSYRDLINALHDYLITGYISNTTVEEDATITDLFNLIINPSREWRVKLIPIIKSISDFESTRIALCNYITAVYLNKLTSITIKSGADEKFISTIDIFTKELTYTCQKGDMISRVTKAILLNAGFFEKGKTLKTNKPPG